VITRYVRTATAAPAAATVVLLVVAILSPTVDLSGSGVLSDGDRRALAPAPALRGAEPAPPDRPVDLTDPAAVSLAYLAAAHSLLPDDAGHTQRRAAAYARPGSPAAVGVVVLDPPPPGAVESAVVTGLELAGAEGDRRGYRAALRIETATPGRPVAVALRHTLVVLAEDTDGRWRVVTETGLPTGED